jgi:hypothetical protein
MVDEFRVMPTRCRVDLLVIDQDLFGIEIKANDASLSVLAEQVATYSQLCQRMALASHGQLLERGRAIVPDWWALIDCGGATPSLVRKAGQNPGATPLLDAQIEHLGASPELTETDPESVIAALRDEKRERPTGYPTTPPNEALHATLTITRRTEKKMRGGELRVYVCPQLLLTGERLAAAGFKIGDQVVVETGPGKVNIRAAVPPSRLRGAEAKPGRRGRRRGATGAR